MTLSGRLQTIVDLVPEGACVADIGADHGLLELYLVQNRKDISILAVENKKGPYDTLFKKLNSVKNVRLSCEGGLTPVDQNIDTLVLAGLGGLNIKHILLEYPRKLAQMKRIIIDAHRDGNVVRRYLVRNGFKISKEKIVYDAEKYYVIMLFEKAEKPVSYSNNVYDFGYKIYEDKLWKRYQKYYLKHLTDELEIITKIPRLNKRVKNLNSLVERLKNYGKN